MKNQLEREEFKKNKKIKIRLKEELLNFGLLTKNILISTGVVPLRTT